MRNKKWRDELCSLINRYSVDTELDAPDWLIMESIDRYLSNIQMFSKHIGYTPLNNAVSKTLRTTAKGRKPKQSAPF